MTWWKWGLAALVVAGLLAGSGFAAGVSRQRADDTKARLAIIAADNLADAAQKVVAAVNATRASGATKKGA